MALNCPRCGITGPFEDLCKQCTYVVYPEGKVCPTCKHNEANDLQSQIDLLRRQVEMIARRLHCGGFVEKEGQNKWYEHIPLSKTDEWKDLK